MGERRMTLKRFLFTVRPGSAGDTWTWADEARDLWNREPEYMRALCASMERNGQGVPVTVGTDGRLWDGHHRVVAAMHLGRTYLRVQMYADMTEVERDEHLFMALEDWEQRAS